MADYKQYYTSQKEIIAMQEELRNAHNQTLQQKDTYTRKKIMRYAGRVVGILLICLLCKVYFDVESAKAKGETPTVFGYQVYEVQSGSMDPTLPVKSLIIAKKYDTNRLLTKGDIITFEHDGTTITHRIIEVHNVDGQISYTTKGDNAQNSIDPEPVYPKEIKATFITKLPFYLSSDESAGDGDV